MAKDQNKTQDEKELVDLPKEAAPGDNAFPEVEIEDEEEATSGESEGETSEDDNDTAKPDGAACANDGELSPTQQVGEVEDL